VDLVLADAHQPLALKDLVHDRRYALMLSQLLLGRGQLLLVRHPPRLLVRLGSRLGGQDRIPRAWRKRHLLQEPAHAADRLAKTPGRAEDVQISGRELSRRHLPDVVDIDINVLGRQLLLDVRRDRRPIAELRSVQILDLHR
jgi:hypothetical protein